MSTQAPLPRVLEPEVMDSDEEARDYDAMDHAEVNRRFCGDLLALGPDLGATLDVGTGTALIPIELCRTTPGARVVGIDLAASMLALGRRNVERAGLTAAIELRLVDAKVLPFPDGSFRCVASNSIVHHIPDPSPALGEMLRVLASGGWLFVRDLLRPRSDEAVSALVRRYAGAEGARARGLFDASLRAALTLDEARDLAAAHGMARDAVSATSDRHWTLAWRKVR